jgi:hypothetical protein
MAYLGLLGWVPSANPPHRARWRPPGWAQRIVGWETHFEDVAPHIRAHPKLGEALGEAHLALAGQPLHAHK